MRPFLSLAKFTDGICPTHRLHTVGPSYRVSHNCRIGPVRRLRNLCTVRNLRKITPVAKNFCIFLLTAAWFLVITRWIVATGPPIVFISLVTLMKVFSSLDWHSLICNCHHFPVMTGIKCTSATSRLPCTCGRFTCDCVAWAAVVAVSTSVGAYRESATRAAGDPMRISPSVCSQQEASHDELR
jgi:hypothetical protein